MSKKDEKREITKDKLATATSVDPKLWDFCSSQTLRKVAFLSPARQLCCHLPAGYYAAINTSGRLFLCQYSLLAREKTAHQQGIALLFQLSHRLFNSTDKVTGEGDIRTCSNCKRGAVGGIRSLMRSFKTSQEGCCRCNPHFHYYISSKLQSPIRFKRWYFPSTWICDSSHGMNWWLAISPAINIQYLLTLKQISVNGKKCEKGEQWVMLFSFNRWIETEKLGK